MIEKFIEKLNVLYEDNHVIVVEKFEDVLSQKDYTDDISMLDIVKYYIKEKYQKKGNVYLGLVHRSDRRVGGLMVFAKTSKAASRLSTEIANHNFYKTYLACVKNKPLKLEDTLIDYLIKDEKKRLAKIVSKYTLNAQEAILKYKYINSFAYNNQIFSFLKIDLITGRYNQIRAQLSYHNMPIIGDYKYQGILHSSRRLGLWCYRLAFKHPTKDEWLEFTLKPEKDFWNFLQKE